VAISVAIAARAISLMRWLVIMIDPFNYSGLS
jgi:hypothetical protein